MKFEAYPLCFAPVYKSYMWGGKRLAAKYGRVDAPEVCAESWEISGHAEGMSVVKNGVYAGETLDALVKRFGAELLGRPLDKFPLIFKLIDARERLSVQVHPSDATAAQWGGEAKSEMWMLLDGEGVTHLYAGVQKGANEAGFRAALANRTTPQLLVDHEVREGDALYIQGGLIHAIGEGCLVYEVQQCSNTTYRLYDWDRVGADGKGRELHIDQGLRVTDWNLGAPPIVHADAATRWCNVIRSPYFDMRQLTLESDTERVAMADSFHALFVKRGNARVEAGGKTMDVPCGSSVLIPVCCGSYAITANGRAQILLTTL